MNIAVIGLGLIGGSAVRALAAAGHQVMGYDADPATRAVARTAAALAPAPARWQVAGSVGEAVPGAEVVIVAVPLPAVGAVFDQLATTGYRGLVTDVTSVKSEVRQLAAERLPLGSRYVGGHPMAGRETSGFEASDSELFSGCAWVLCLEPGETRLAGWLDLAALITGIGARVVPTTAADHDQAVARVSHVPHLLAMALAAAASGDPLALALGAGSFRDGTRVAATRPELVAAMCGGNAAAVKAALDSTLSGLASARRALASPDPVAELRTWCQQGYQTRSSWPAPGGPPAVVAATVDALSSLGKAGGWVTAVAPNRVTVTAQRPSVRDDHPDRGESPAGL